MELHGSIEQNLAAAVRSARRLKGHPIHADTIEHWTELLSQARRELDGNPRDPMKDLILELENELADL